MHWDHIGDPQDFPRSTFVVGHGAVDLLEGRTSSGHGSHAFFEQDLLPEGRSLELSNPEVDEQNDLGAQKVGEANFRQPWTSHEELPHVIDLFRDGSLHIVDAPGHLAGHINVLARTSPTKRVYLAGDACHDRRIMRKELEIGSWKDAEGQICCIHSDVEKAKETIARIQRLEEEGVEIVFAHDVEWAENPDNAEQIWGKV